MTQWAIDQVFCTEWTIHRFPVHQVQIAVGVKLFYSWKSCVCFLNCKLNMHRVRRFHSQNFKSII